MLIFKIFLHNFTCMNALIKSQTIVIPLSVPDVIHISANLKKKKVFFVFEHTQIDSWLNKSSAFAGADQK